MNYVNLRWGYNAESGHDAVWVLLSDLADKECTHAWTSASSQGMRELKALEAVTVFCLFSHHIQNRVHQLSSLCVVTFSPVITSTTLTWNTGKYSLLCCQNSLMYHKSVYIHRKQLLFPLKRKNWFLTHKTQVQLGLSSFSPHVGRNYVQTVYRYVQTICY